tara:strand:- start:230 stop:580 length:351 start_codon:yes stop_codon:yes gene_type:complete
MIGILMLLISCAKEPLTPAAARSYFQGPECLKILKEKMMEAGCPKLQYQILGTNDTMLRCHKPEKERGKFWDNYIFRISPSNLQYDTKSQIMIEKHTICSNSHIRIEAYPPPPQEK